MSTARRYHAATSEKLHVNAITSDQQKGWPRYLLHAMLQNHARASFKALLEGTSLDIINKSNIDIDKALPREFELKKPVYSTLAELWNDRSIMSFTTSLLHIASQLCSEDVLKLLLDKGADPSLFDSTDWTPLHLVAWRGRTIAMRLILDAGVDPDIRGASTRRWSGSTPFRQAVMGGHISAVDMLLAAGANPNAVYPFWPNPLIIATKLRNMEMLEYLLRTNLFTGRTMTEAFTWARPDKITIPLKAFLDAGMDPQPCLQIAVKSGRPDYVELLINAGADPRKSPTILAWVRDLKSLQLLLDRSPGLSTETIQGSTALEMLYGTMKEIYQYAREDFDTHSLEEMAMMVIRDGCPIREQAVSDDGKQHHGNILAQVALLGHARVIETILPRAKAYVNMLVDRCSPLHIAIEANRAKDKLGCVRALIEHGANIHIHDKYGRPPLDCLFVASIYSPHHKPQPSLQDAAITQCFVDHGLDVSGPTVNRFSKEPLLLRTLASGGDAAALVMMDAGADIYAKASNSWSSLQLAAQHGCCKSMQRLLQADKVNTLLESATHSTLLHFAVSGGVMKHQRVRGYGKMMAHLLLGHMDVTAEDVAGTDSSELQSLAHTGCMEVIRILCNEGIVDPGTRNSEGYTPFDTIITMKGIPQLGNIRGKHKAELKALRKQAGEKWPRLKEER
ncbi:ankyrin repeat-containing domain protein [Xylogone sp. PMI_703]|nr:ankyrin repeat-containing domain protein [Xylogone sp. PMI_703]